MVPLANVVRVRETTAPQVISHFNLFRSAQISGSAAPGVSSGQALAEMERLAGTALPQGFGYAWSGISLEEIKAGGQSAAIFGIAPAARLPDAGGAVRVAGAAVHRAARRAAGGARRAVGAVGCAGCRTTCTARSDW